MASRTSRRAAMLGFVAAANRAVKPGTPSLAARVAAVPRMVGSVLRGEFRGLSAGRLLALAAGVAYVVSPVDLVPEGLLSVFGLADDAVVLAWLATALVADTEGFLAWERGGRSGRRDHGHAGASAGPTPQDATDAQWRAARAEQDRRGPKPPQHGGQQGPVVRSSVLH